MKYHDEHWYRLKPLWNPEVFLEIERIKIAKTILQISESDTPVCLPVILDAMGSDASMFVTKLYDYAPIEMNVEWMLRQLNDWYNIKKHVPEIGSVIQKIVASKSTDKTDDLLNDLKNISQKMYEARSDQSDCFSIEEILDSTIETILNRIENKSGIENEYIKSGLDKLDNSIMGLRGGRFYIIAARPSVGKTSFATYLCLEAMKQSRKPIFFSNEMSKEEIMEKMISSVSGIPGSTLQTGALTDVQNGMLTEAINRLAKYKILIDEKSGWSLDHLLSTVYKKHSRGQCDLVFVDYLQQVRVPKSQNKTEQVSIVSDAMKKLARDLNIPVIGLAQINRDAEKTNGKDIAPSLIHIKDSGSLEQDADVVIILHRTEESHDDNFTNIDLKLAKNRHGKVGTCSLKFNHHLCRYASKS